MDKIDEYFERKNKGHIGFDADKFVTSLKDVIHKEHIKMLRRRRRAEFWRKVRSWFRMGD